MARSTRCAQIADMDKGTTKKLAKLRMLARLDVDAIAAYDAAIARVDVEAVKAKLTEFRLDHARHVQDLNALIAKVGGDPVTLDPMVVGTLLKTVTSVGSMFGTEAALVSMMGNEGLTNVSYEMALKLDWQPEEREVIEKNRADERRHLAWIKDAVLHRRWAQEEARAGA